MNDHKAMFCEFLLCEGPKSYVLQDFVMWRTEKLGFAIFCYGKDRKARFCKEFTDNNAIDIFIVIKTKEL